MYIKIIFSVIAISSTFIVKSQDSSSTEFISNRIGFTESSRAVKKGSVLLEGGVGYTIFNPSQFQPSLSKDVLLKLPDLNLAYGLTENFELRLSTNYLSYISNKSETNSMRFSSQYISIGAKLNLTQQKKWVPQMALLVNQGMYSSSFVEGNYWQSDVKLLWSYSIKKFKVSGSMYF